MSDFVVSPPPVVAVPVAGGGAFPVRRVFCVGRNYSEHVREMGGDPSAGEAPFFFSKPADALVVGGGDTPYPSATSDLHHEIELVVAIGRDGSAIAPAMALGHVWGYGVGIDLTRRDLQAEAKKKGRPWDMAKGFDFSAPIGALVAASQIGHPAAGAITLTVNGTVRQSGDIGEMIAGVPQLIAALSQLVTLKAGDLIFTGTPSGVAAVVRGDVLEGEAAGVGSVRTRIV
jgi:fumarylpyruvate hydrolase